MPSRTASRIVVALLATVSMQTSANAQAKAVLQHQLEERVEELEKRVDAEEQKATKAEMEKDYLQRVQKQYEAYYKEALETVKWSLAIFGLFLTAVLAIASRFSLQIFDSQVKGALTGASAQIEQKFAEKMQTEIKTLQAENAERLTDLENVLSKQISEQVTKVEARSKRGFFFVQGLSFAMTREHKQALEAFRQTLEVTIENPQCFSPDMAICDLVNLLRSIHDREPEKFVENARKELARDFYKTVQNHLNKAIAELAHEFPEAHRLRDEPLPQ
ncbi:MAG TPA: hypothetical protein VKP58_09255 [Candidatus Acidoferrum sp.]|nr:hypothetical protein [Candidatus Acidoferrum sp.]